MDNLFTEAMGRTLSHAPPPTLSHLPNPSDLEGEPAQATEHSGELVKKFTTHRKCLEL